MSMRASRGFRRAVQQRPWSVCCRSSSGFDAFSKPQVTQLVCRRWAGTTRSGSLHRVPRSAWQRACRPFITGATRCAHCLGPRGSWVCTRLDPTLDTRLPAKATRPARPLTDAEIEVGRSVAMWSLTSARYRLVWALAEATARGSELASVAWRDVELDQGTVSLPGDRGHGLGWGSSPTGVSTRCAQRQASQTTPSSSGTGVRASLGGACWRRTR